MHPKFPNSPRKLRASTSILLFLMISGGAHWLTTRSLVSAYAQDVGIVERLKIVSEMKAVREDDKRLAGAFLLENSLVLQKEIGDRVGAALPVIKGELRKAPWNVAAYVVMIGRVADPQIKVLRTAYYVGSGNSVAEIAIADEATPRIGMREIGSLMPEESYYIVFELVGDQLFAGKVLYNVVQAQKERLKGVEGRSIDLHAEMLRVIWKRDELGMTQPKIAPQAAQARQPQSGGRAAGERTDRGNIHDAHKESKTVEGNSVGSEKNPSGNSGGSGGPQNNEGGSSKHTENMTGGGVKKIP